MRAVVITVAQQKGGAGKTTLVANLAAAWAAASRRVAALDMDPQRSLARWAALRGESGVDVAECAGWRLSRELDRLHSDHDVILVDSPPQIDADARRAVRAATLVLVPIQPSPPDIWAAEGTLRVAAEEKRPAALVLNRVQTAPRLRETADRELRTRGLTPLTATIGNRAAHSHAFAEGLGVTEAAPRSLAAAEVRALADAIWAIVR
jgi:chromosome partitioning protein